MENFRIVQDGDAIEVDVTLILETGAVMDDFMNILRDVARVDGVRSTKVDDLPNAIVEQTIKKDSESAS